MITVSILINGHPIFTRTAVNTGKRDNGATIYSTDAGDKILHNPQYGAVSLGHKLLDTIKEEGVWNGEDE